MRHKTWIIAAVFTVCLAMQAAIPAFAAETVAPPKTAASEAPSVLKSEPDAKEQTQVNPENYTVRGIGVDGLKVVPIRVVMDAVSKTIVGEKFKAGNVQADLQSIVDTGFFSNVEAALEMVEGGIKVIFLPVENEIVKSIKFECEVLDPGVFRKYFSQKDGEIANFVKLHEDLNMLQQRVMNDHGLVVRPAEVSSEKGEYLIKITPVKVGKINVEGNGKTRDKVIMREINHKTGDNLNMSRFNLDLQHLWQTGFFDEIEPVLEQPDGPDTVNITIKVVERKTGSAAFGAGYSTLDGLLGYLEYNEDNFLGRGERVTARTEFGQKKTSYDLGFNEPYLMGTRTSFGVNLYDRSYDRTKEEDDKEIAYNEYRRGGDLSLGRPLGEFTQGHVTLKIEDIRQEPKTAGSMDPVNEKTRSVIFNTNTDTTTGHPFYPLGGMRANLSVEAAGKFLGGDTQYTKFTGETSRYFKVGRANQVLAFRLVGGRAQGSLPEYEQFKVGGADTVRGYKYGAMKGDRMLYGNGEYRFKLTNALHAALFIDVGQAWTGSEGGPGKFKVGYGAGLRIDTPLGMMRLDYGIGENGGSTFFSLGPSF